MENKFEKILEQTPVQAQDELYDEALQNQIENLWQTTRFVSNYTKYIHNKTPVILETLAKLRKEISELESLNR